MPGTNLGYAATSRSDRPCVGRTEVGPCPLSSYPFAMRCPVLTRVCTTSRLALPPFMCALPCIAYIN
eukprot:1782587-Rhodomonas_salina.1